MQCIPNELSEQLKKVDFLSSTTISMLRIEKENSRGLDHENIFLKMNEARRGQ